MKTVLRAIVMILDFVLLIPLRILLVLMGAICITIADICSGNFVEEMRRDIRGNNANGKKQWGYNMQWVRTGGEYRTIFDKEEA